MSVVFIALRVPGTSLNSSMVSKESTVWSEVRRATRAQLLTRYPNVGLHVQEPTRSPCVVVYPWGNEPTTRHHTDYQLPLDGRVAKDHTHSGPLHSASTGMSNS